MDLNKIFLWLDIDGTVLNSGVLRKAIGENVLRKEASLAAVKDFWQVYDLLRRKNGTIHLEKAIDVWARKYGLSKQKIVSETKQLSFEDFLYLDFQDAAGELKKFGGLGFFSEGTVWFQRQKVTSVKKFLKRWRIVSQRTILSEDKKRLFGKMRKGSKSFFLFTLIINCRY